MILAPAIASQEQNGGRLQSQTQPLMPASSKHGWNHERVSNLPCVPSRGNTESEAFWPGGFTAPEPGSIVEPLQVLIELKQQGLIRHIGLSTVTPEQLVEAQSLTEIVCIQNFYNLANRGDDAFIDDLARQGIAYVPYFPLGGFSPLQSSVVDAVAASLGITPMQVAQAWLLHRSPNILLIAGTSKRTHLRENLGIDGIQLTPEIIARLDSISVTTKP